MRVVWEAVCETTEHQWRVPAGGKVRTVFDFAAVTYTWELRGSAGPSPSTGGP
jgi:hypothetical protein